MQARTVCFCAGALAALLASAAFAQDPASERPTAPPETPAPPPKPADISQAVDENGVPAWAKRKRKAPVQNCETQPNIGIETWRERYSSSNGPERHKVRPPQATCR